MIIWPHAAQQPENLAPEDCEKGADLIEQSGTQHPPAIGRAVDDSFIEIVGNAYVVSFVAAYNQRHPENRINIPVQMRTLNDDDAFRLVAAELREGPVVSPWEKGRFYLAAISRYGSEAEAARVLGVHKSTISRRLDVARAVHVFGSKIVCHRDVAQRDASWLMEVLGRAPNFSEAPNLDAAQAVVIAYAEAEPMPAKQLFNVLRAALKVEAPKPWITNLALGNHKLGTISRKKNGPIHINIDAAGDIELDALVEVLRDALARVRAPNTL
ncbi:hypothetical protein [Sphingomonas sp. ID0503]|uniref:hypothetical protein n=1 Tax=Sphingomonas sp. ID0503 TaxID=3399691 RepID=UPI003AFAC485